MSTRRNEAKKPANIHMDLFRKHRFIFQNKKIADDCGIRASLDFLSKEA